MSSNFSSINRVGTVQIRDVNRTVTLGDPVVPLSDIIDVLGSKIDADTLQGLLRDLVAGRRTQVRPGEIITAELMNQILTQLESVEERLTKFGAGTTGGVIVPNLFSRTLLQAANILKQTQIGLKFGNVVDAFGTSIDPDQVASRSRLVINQVPEPGSRVNPGSFVDVLVAAVGGSGGTTQPTAKPTIDPAGFNPSRVPIGQDVTILGNNFALDRTKNIVTFDGIPQDGDPTPESEKTKLVVKVPRLPSPIPAGTEKRVTVIVETPEGGKSEAAQLTLLPALEGSNPTIGTIESSDVNFARIDDVITINGAGFSVTLNQNVIAFGTVTTFPEPGVSPTRLRVRVPAISGLVRADDFKDVSISVTANSRKSNVIGPFTIGGKLPNT